MKSDNKEVYVLGVRVYPSLKSLTAYSRYTRKELMVAALNGLIQQYKLDGQLIGDTALGALINSSSDWNLARECLLSTTLHPESPAYNVQRACGTSLDATWQIALKIFTGEITVGIAGGVDTNSDLPLEVSEEMKRFFIEWKMATGLKEKLKALRHLAPASLLPKIPTANEPRTQLSMANIASGWFRNGKFRVRRQDRLALASHLNASKAYKEGFFDDLVHPFGGLQRDSILRDNTSLELLSKLKPAFDANKGTLTAGNSSPLTDGAACVLLGSQETAAQLGLQPLAKIIDVQVAAVDFVHGAGLLMAPTKAVAQLFARNRLSFEDFDYLEIHEAFAGQVLCNLKAWESEKYCRAVLGLSSPLGSFDRQKMNVLGSSIALGHPYAATGARIVGTLAKLLGREKNKRGLISICTAGGMGVAAILESAT